ncbi:hypothetical protein ABPG74_018590 [Tetrahymena malaccensis]
MIGLKTSKQRFNLFYLDESELYTEDFSGYCIYKSIHTEEEHKERGKFHICSRSIIFESDNPEIPLMKFGYRAMIKPPQLKLEENKRSQQETKTLGSNKDDNSVEIIVNKVVEIDTSGPPSPYIHHDFEKAPFFYVNIIPIYDNVQRVQQWISQLYDIQKSSPYSGNQEEEIQQILMEKNGKKKFNMSQTESVSEKPLLNNQLICRQILPLNSIYGILYATNKNIYFQPIHNISTKPVKIIPIEYIFRLYKRRFELKNIGLEMMVSNKNKSYYFAFEDQNNRDLLYNALLRQVSQECISDLSLEKVTFMWQNYQITNYEYLMHLNHAGNRSFADLSQYPVFPWVISNYNSTEIDINDPANYRDLKKPIGALNPKRLKDFKDRYLDMPSPKFLYGTHYSTPGYVIGYLVRKKPEYMLKLQSGKFDKPDRLFKSIKGDWRNVLDNPTSVKELIPEYFQNDDSFLMNYKDLNFGIRQNGKKVDAVKLPKWAKGDAKEFLRVNREALESEIVSQNLHHWIDLIFGYKQRGQHSIDADNVFHHLTYEGMVDLDAIQDPIERQALRCQINEFGQCPKQLFKIPHTPRRLPAQSPLNGLSQSLNFDWSNGKGSLDLNGQLQASSSFEEYKDRNSLPGNSIFSTQKARDSIQGSNNKMAESYVQTNNSNKYLWEVYDGNKSQLQVDLISKAHKKNVTQIRKLKKKQNQIISIGEDGFLKVCDLPNKSVIKSFKICDLNLSSFVPIKEDEIFAIGCWDNKLYIFNLNYGSKVKVLSIHNESISSLSYFSSLNTLFTASWDCTVKQFVCEDGQLDEDSEDIFWDHDSQITHISGNKEETLLGVGDVDGHVNIIDVNTKQVKFSFQIPEQKITKIVFSKNHLVASGDNIIKHYELNGTELCQFDVELQNGSITDFDIDGRNLVVITNKGHIAIFDLLTEKKVGHYFNDFSEGDFDIAEDQQFSCMTTYKDEDNLITAYLGSINGSINILYKS